MKTYLTFSKVVNIKYGINNKILENTNNKRNVFSSK